MIIRVAIFEDNDRLRRGLEQLINSSGDMECTGSFPDADKLHQKMQHAAPDVVVMDINMPGVSGIEAVMLIKEKFGDVRVVMQTVFDDNDKIFGAICAGASGYILKKTPPGKILEAIRDTYHGGAPMTPTVAVKVLEMVRSQSESKKTEFIDLSKREREILTLLVKGRSYKSIAATCFISIDTVSTHVRHIYEKLHVHSKSEAVAKAILQRIV